MAWQPCSQPPGHGNVAVSDVNKVSVMFICAAEDRNVRRETRKHACTDTNTSHVCGYAAVSVCARVHIKPRADFIVTEFGICSVLLE